MDNLSDEMPDIQRQAFLSALALHIANSITDNTVLGLVLINIDNLTKINHSIGFGAGDTLIQTSYARLLSISKLPQTLYRIGSHQFAFILPALTSPALITLAMSKVKNLLLDEITYKNEALEADVQIGFALDIEGKLDVEDFIVLAERSLAQAKKGILVGNDSEEYRPALQQQKSLEKSFRDTLRNNGFELYYQPQLNFHTGKVDKAEALLRWKPPEKGFISPEVTLELAERQGKSFLLTKWVIHTAIQQIKHWQDTLGIGIAVNVQSDLLAKSELVALVNDALAIWGVDKKQLTLELTESAVIEDKQAGLNNLLQLQESGVSLSIDDFGTGYSSLSYFKEIPASELKIDKSFVLNMESNQQDRDIIKVIIKIAHLFGMKVVAEGIEDQASLDYLKEQGCDYGQGYHIARPMPMDEFEAWYQENSNFSKSLA